MAVLDPRKTQFLEEWMQSLPAHERDLFKDLLLKSVQVITASPQEPANSLAQSLTDRTFTQEERITLEIETLMRYFQQRRNLLQSSLSTREVAELLGTSRQTPHDRVKAKTLLGLRDNGEVKFPAWQFDPEGQDGVIDGLPEVLKTLQLSDFAKLNWLMRPNPFLNGLSPVEALKQRQKDRVLQEAIGVGDT